MESFSQYAVAAAKEAFEDAGLDMAEEDPYRIGTIRSSEAKYVLLFRDTFSEAASRARMTAFFPQGSVQVQQRPFWMRNTAS